MAQGNGLGMSRSATDFIALLVVHSAIFFFLEQNAGLSLRCVRTAITKGKKASF